MTLEIVGKYNFGWRVKKPEMELYLKFLMAKVRSVYKELHADHETGTADNK